MSELGFSQDAELLKRLRAAQGLATLWVAIYTGEHRGDPFVDAFLVESPDKPSEYGVLEYILGREPNEEDGILTITGPFIWPDPDDEPVITRRIHDNKVGEKRQEAKEAPVRHAYKRKERIPTSETNEGA